MTALMQPPPSPPCMHTLTPDTRSIPVYPCKLLIPLYLCESSLCCVLKFMSIWHTRYVVIGSHTWHTIHEAVGLAVVMFYHLVKHHVVRQSEKHIYMIINLVWKTHDLYNYYPSLKNTTIQLLPRSEKHIYTIITPVWKTHLYNYYPSLKNISIQLLPQSEKTRIYTIIIYTYRERNCPWFSLPTTMNVCSPPHPITTSHPVYSASRSCWSIFSNSSFNIQNRLNYLLILPISWGRMLWIISIALFSEQSLVSPITGEWKMHRSAIIPESDLTSTVTSMLSETTKAAKLKISSRLTDHQTHPDIHLQTESLP